VLSLAERIEDIITPVQNVEILIFCGDSAYGLEEYPRAENFYRRALQCYKYLLKSQPLIKDFLPEDCSNSKIFTTLN